MSDLTRCPTCGKVMYVEEEADRLLAILRSGEREVYRAQGGGWFVTRGGGQFSFEAISELLRRRAIVSVYSTCPNDVYHVGKTLDMDATLAYRKGREKREWKRIYTDGSLSA